MTLNEMKDKIIEDRRLAFDAKLIEREASFPTLEKMATVLVGARKVGKSSLLRLYAQKLRREGINEERIVYLSFLGYANGEIPFSLIIDAYYSLYPENISYTVYFLIDEIQATELWGAKIADLMDRCNCRVVVTGSNAKLLSTDIATELRGSCIPVRFYSLSFEEFLAFRNSKLKKKDAYEERERYELLKFYEEYLEKGSYPLLANIDDKDLRNSILLSYLDVTYSRDLIDRYEPEKAVVLKKIFDSRVRQSGQMYTLSRIIHTLKSQGYKGVTNEIVSSFLEMLVDSCFFIEVPILGNESRINVNPKKMYTSDHAVSTIFSSFTQSRGVRLEHAILMVLYRVSPYVYYHRTKDNYEVDFVLTDRFKNPLMLVQVTDDYSLSKEREVRAISKAMEELKVNKGYIVTMYDEEEISVDAGVIFVLPAWRFSLNVPKY